MKELFFIIALIIGSGEDVAVVPVLISEQPTEEICYDVVDELAFSLEADKEQWEGLMAEFGASELIGGCYPKHVAEDLLGRPIEE